MYVLSIESYLYAFKLALVLTLGDCHQAQESYGTLNFKLAFLRGNFAPTWLVFVGLVTYTCRQTTFSHTD